MAIVCIDGINSEITNINALSANKIAELKEIKISLIKRKRFLCVHCQKVSPLGKFGFVQSWWYTMPHGCTEGDYWTPSETKVCHIVCPKCDTKNYICNHPKRDELIDLIDKQDINKEKIFSVIWKQCGSQEPKQTYPKLD